MTDLEARIAVLTPKAGDSIVISHATHMLTKVQCEAIKSAAAAALPEGVKVLVLSGGLTMQHVVAPTALTDGLGG